MRVTDDFETFSLWSHYCLMYVHSHIHPFNMTSNVHKSGIAILYIVQSLTWHIYVLLASPVAQTCGLPPSSVQSVPLLQ